MINPPRISTRQFMLLFIMLVFSPSIRIFPTIIGVEAKQASWICPLIAMVSLMIIVAILHDLFKNHQNINLIGLYCRILTKPVGFAVASVCFFWIMILLSLYVRYYAERLLSSFIIEASIEFITIIMLLLVFIVIRGGIVALARFNELLFGLFIFAFLASTSISIFENIEFANLLPISRLDTIPVLSSSVSIMGIWGYIVILFFFADQVNHQQDIRKQGFRSALLLCVLGMMIIVVTVGSIGHLAVATPFQPYFAVVKNISSFYPLERFESIIISMWIIADYSIIAIFTYIAVNMIKTSFKLPDTPELASPIIFIVFSLSMLISRNRYELEEFTKNIALPINIILFVGLPITLWIVGKFRKII